MRVANRATRPGERSPLTTTALTQALVAELGVLVRRLEAMPAEMDPSLSPRIRRAARLAVRWLSHSQRGSAPAETAAGDVASPPSAASPPDAAAEGDAHAALLAILDRLERLEQENRQLRAELETRQRGWSYAIHELRNAADALTYWLYSLRHTEQQGAEWYGPVLRSAEAVLRRSEDAFSAGEGPLQQREVSAEQFNLVEVARAALEQALPSAEANGLKTALLAPPVDRPVLVLADRDAAFQILHNLMRNAVAATPDGGAIVLTLSGRDAFGRVEVSDTGPGVDPEDTESLFLEPDLSKHRAAHRRGLGLPLSREFARRMGGDLTLATPKAATGAAFTLLLPLATP